MSNLSKNTINILKEIIVKNTQRLEDLNKYYELIIHEDSRIINLDVNDEDYHELKQFFIDKMDNITVSTEHAKIILNKNE